MGVISDVVNAIQPIEEKIAAQVVMGSLEVAVPFFALPIVSQITEFLVSRFIDYIVNGLNLFTVQISTIIEVGMQQNSFSKAAFAHMEAQTNGTDEQKKQTQNDLLSSARKFILLNTP